jgi:hypothetical protein
MRMHTAAVLIGLLAITAPALADSVAVTSGPNGTTIVNGKPCRVVTGKQGGSNSTSITAGGGSVSGTTSVSPGGSGSSVTVGSGSSGGNSSSAATSNCVIHRPSKK